MDCIVSEVHVGLGVVESIFGGGGAYVSSFEPVSFKSSVYYCPQHVVADVEFPTVVEEGLLDVLLHDECLGSPVIVHPSPLQNTLYLLQTKTYSYSISPVG